MNPTTTQPAAIKAATTTFTTEKKGTGEFTAQKSAKIAEAALKAIVDKDGNAISWSETEIAAFKSPFYATVGNRAAALRTVLEKRGVEPDGVLIGLLKDFFNPAAVQKKIEAAKAAPQLTVKHFLAAEE